MRVPQVKVDQQVERQAVHLHPQHLIAAWSGGSSRGGGGAVRQARCGCMLAGWRLQHALPHAHTQQAGEVPSLTLVALHQVGRLHNSRQQIHQHLHRGAAHGGMSTVWRK